MNEPQGCIVGLVQVAGKEVAHCGEGSRNCARIAKLAVSEQQ